MKLGKKRREGMCMRWSIIKYDLVRNKAINTTLFLFMALSACLVVLSVITAVQTFTSITNLYEVAQPPHFLQMHKGPIDTDQIADFMSNHDSTTYWQVVPMLNVYGHNIRIVGEDSYDLSDIRLDIGLVTQNDTHGLLLDAEHQKVTLRDGEIGMPVLLRDMYSMELGDRVILTNNGHRAEFTISHFVLDAQMNTPMVSSTRILLSDGDMERLLNFGWEKEYLIEAYFSDTSEASAFQTAYENAGLAQNGQAVTYAIIFLLSALTDIITIFVLLLVSVLLILVSFLCIKFTIMATLEEEVREIGTMKAIGFSFPDIRDIYLSKYRILAVVAIIAGFILALLLSAQVTSHISSSFGGEAISPLAIYLSLAASLIVFFLINHQAKRVLKAIKKLTIVDALVSGQGFTKAADKVKDGLHGVKRLSVNWALSLGEVRYGFKNYAIVFSVMVIAVMLIMIPINLLHTFEAPEFITYMGRALGDILIEIEDETNVQARHGKVVDLLQHDQDILSYFESRRVRVQTTSSEDQVMNLHIDSGVNSGDGLQYLVGRSPQGDAELALSYLNAEELGKQAGDTIMLRYNGEDVELVVSGIYQDVTSGGFTAKSQYAFPELESSKYSFSVNLHDQGRIAAKVATWTETLGSGVTVDPMEEFSNQTLGGVAVRLRGVVLATIVVGAVIALLITVLFLKLRLAKELSKLAILKAIGFSEPDLKKQYLMKIGLVSALGIVVGIALTSVLGQQIVNGALGLAGLGIRKVVLLSDPLVQFVLCPALLLTLILVCTWFVAGGIKRYNIISIINE